MNNKRVFGILGICLLLSMIFMQFASAAPAEITGESTMDATQKVIDIVAGILKPVFGLLLGLNEYGSSDSILKILAFVLMFVIIFGTFNSINLFNSHKGTGQLLNITIGIIVSVIGVRFLPDGMLASLTAPSSALVATIIVGAPFIAMFFITMKLHKPAVRKFVWAFFVLALIYIVMVEGADNSFKWVYVAFAVISVIMLLLDGTIQGMFMKGKALSGLNFMQRNTLNIKIGKIEKDMKELFETMSSTSKSGGDEVPGMQADYNRLKAKHDDLVAQLAKYQ